MSVRDKDNYYEHKHKDLMNDLLGHLLTNEQGMSDFLCWADEKYPDLVQKALNEWLEKDKAGKKWFEDTRDGLVSNMPENDEHDSREDR